MFISAEEIKASAEEFDCCKRDILAERTCFVMADLTLAWTLRPLYLNGLIFFSSVDWMMPVKIALIENIRTQCFGFDFGDNFVLRLRGGGRWNNRFRINLLRRDGGESSFRIDRANVRHVKASHDNWIRTSRYDSPSRDTRYWQCRPAQHVELQ